MIIYGLCPALWIMESGCGCADTAGLPSFSTVVSPAGPGEAGVYAGQAVRGGAWVAVNKPLKASRCGQLSGRWRVMRRARRAIRAGTVISRRRSVLVRDVA